MDTHTDTLPLDTPFMVLKGRPFDHFTNILVTNTLHTTFCLEWFNGLFKEGCEDIPSASVSNGHIQNDLLWRPNQRFATLAIFSVLPLKLILIALSEKYKSGIFVSSMLTCDSLWASVVVRALKVNIVLVRCSSVSAYYCWCSCYLSKLGYTLCMCLYRQLSKLTNE